MTVLPNAICNNVPIGNLDQFINQPFIAGILVHWDRLSGAVVPANHYQLGCRISQPL
jgi:hypothetical protein